LYPDDSLCTFDVYSTATAAYAPGNTVYSSLPCSGGYVDVFTFEGSAGGSAYLTVDTTSEDPAVDAAMWIYGPDQCVDGIASRNFPCSLGGGDCPAMSVAT